MAKKRILEGGKRDELIIAAKELFLENGYEGTSVRMIVKNVGGEIGMFYHYFKSKDEIFDEAIKLFFTQYEQSFSDILSNGTIPQNSIIDLIFELFSKSLHEYKILKAGNFHWSMRIALNQLTLQSLIPHVSKYISNMRNRGEIEGCADITDSELANTVVYTSFAILHERPLTEYSEEELLQKKQRIKSIIHRIMEVKRNE